MAGPWVWGRYRAKQLTSIQEPDQVLVEINLFSDPLIYFP